MTEITIYIRKLDFLRLFITLNFHLPISKFVNLVNLGFQEELHTFSTKNIDFCEFFFLT